MKNAKELKDVSGNGFSMYFAHECSACCGQSKSVRREFSDQAVTALVLWGEIESKHVDQPLCNDCYFNLRDVLIERVADIGTITSPIGSAASSRPVHAVGA